ncbi:MAG: carboxypeptidase regulatory-like domain-containing protein [Gemmatimonadaceae bacterium]|nr:carboxypeptidase regulatory-like domain-containing protein [Gemmatimonadaceae bacterium]
MPSRCVVTPLGLLFSLCAVTAHAQGVVRGVVTDGVRPVPGAEVRLLREDDDANARQPRVALSSDSGRFEFTGLPAGTYSIAARQLGYRLTSQRLTLAPAQQRDIVLVLDSVVQSLDTVSVTARGNVPPRYEASVRMSTFYERRARGVGQFFTREELEAHTSKGMEDILRRVRGLRIRRLPDGSLEVLAARCQGNTIRPANLREPSFTGTQVYVNGSRLDWRGAGEILASFHANDIEAIEVYRGPSELPVDAIGDACAAIFIWTRFGS